MKFVEKIEPQMKVFRITPHAKLENNTRRLYLALYELFNSNTRKYTWTIRKPFYVAIRKSDAFFWVCKMCATDEGKRIEFFVVIPAEFEKAFRTKWKNHKNRTLCALEEATDQFVGVTDMIHTDLYKVKYKRHDMFSLKYNHSEDTTPIRELMNVSDDLILGESVSLFIRCESLDRGKWRKITDYAREQFQKGGMPYRNGVEPKRLLRDAFGLFGYLGYELRRLGDDTMTAIGNSFFHGRQEPKKKERPKRTNKDREELLVSGSLSNQTNEKWKNPAFKTSIRVAVTSRDKVRRNMLTRGVESAYEALNGDNALQMVKVNIRAKEEMNNLTKWQINEQDPMHMSVDEMARMQQLPTSPLQTEYQDSLTSNKRVEIELPKTFLDPNGLLVGTATDRGVVHNIHIPVDNKDRLFTPRVINGSPRMGKDMFCVNLIVEAKRKHGIGAVIPDFIDERGKDGKGNWRGMANAIRDHLQPEDVIDVDFSNTAYSFFLGLQMIFRNVKDERIAADLISEYLCDFLMADGDEDKFQTQEYAREAAKAAMGDLLGMKQMFTSSTFRQQKIDELQDLLDMTLWEDFERMTDKDGGMSGKQGMIAGPVLRRIGQLTGREYLKTMFCQSNPNVKGDLFQWIRDGKVVIFRVRMPDGIAMPPQVKEILAYWIYLLTFLIKLTLGGEGAGTYIVLNEPVQYLSHGMVRLVERTLAEGPKFRFTPVIVFHDFSQFKKFPGFVDMLLASSVNWHLFKNTNEKVYDRLMPYLSKTFDTPQEAFEATKAFQYIAVWLNNEAEYEPPFVCDALPMVGDRYETLNNEHLTAEHIKMFGRPTQEVLREFKERNRLTNQTG